MPTAVTTATDRITTDRAGLPHVVVTAHVLGGPLAISPSAYVALLRSIADDAAAQMAPHRQYDGMFHDESVRLVRVKSSVKTKLGVAFMCDEVSIAMPGTRSVSVPPQFGYLSFEQWPTVDFVAVWSLRNAVWTMVPAEHVEILAASA